MDEAVIEVVSVGEKTYKMNWVEELHAGVALAKPPPMLKSVREKYFREKQTGEWFCRVFCVPLTSVAFSFIIECLINGQWIAVFMFND